MKHMKHMKQMKQMKRSNQTYAQPSAQQPKLISLNVT